MEYTDDKELTQNNENEETETTEEIIIEDDNSELIEIEESEEIVDEVEVIESNDIEESFDNYEEVNEKTNSNDLFAEPEKPKKSRLAMIIGVALVAVVLIVFGYLVMTKSSSGIADVDETVYQQGMAFVNLLKGDTLLDTDFLLGAKSPSEILNEADNKTYEEFTTTLNAMDFENETANTQTFVNMIVIAFNTRMNQGIFQYFYTTADSNPSFEGLDKEQILQVAATYGEIADDTIAIIEKKNIDDMNTYINSGEFSTKLAPYDEFLSELSSRMDDSTVE